MATGADYEVVDVSSGEEITNPGANDVMVAFHKSTGALEKIDYNKLAKAIIEQYTGSTIGGAAQSVKAALDSKVSGTKLVWGKTLTFECPINGRYLVFVGGNNMFIGINYSDRATLNELVKKDDITVTASKNGTSITITSSVDANITAFHI